METKRRTEKKTTGEKKRTRIGRRKADGVMGSTVGAPLIYSAVL